MPIFSIAIANTKVAWADDCRKSEEQLLKILVGILIEQKLPTTGVDIDTLPQGFRECLGECLELPRWPGPGMPLKTTNHFRHALTAQLDILGMP